MPDIDKSIAVIRNIAPVPTLLEVVCRTTGMGFAAVARVTQDRWVTCGVRDEIGFGLTPGGELMVETTICSEIRESKQTVVIENVMDDPIYCRHQTPILYGFQSYISTPIILANGDFFGTLCALDPSPRRLNNSETIGMFKLFAELIAFHLDAHLKMASVSASLADELQTSELRNQFIAVLGHDLRNPLAAISAGARLLARKDLDDATISLVGQMLRSVDRMSELIDNVLDFARGRLGGGFPIERSVDKPLRPTLEHVIAEMRAAYPNRRIETNFDQADVTDCDLPRIGQLLSNLVSNAFKHGAPEEPVKVATRVSDGVFALTVVNKGEPISSATMENLFKPFFRAPEHAGQKNLGLGLGLYIASEIARSHGGELEASSNDEETCFTFTLPLSR